MKLVDIGLNLDSPRFDRDRAAVLARARAAGVVEMVLTGTSVEGSARVLDLAREHGLVATVGVHPHQADQLDAAGLERLAELARDPRCVAIGECGLDFERDLSPRADQERAFQAQIELAIALGKPLFLHQRGAWARFAAILGPAMGRLPGAVVHCFTEGPPEAREALDLGCHLGVTGWVCDDRRAGPLRAAIPEIPAARLVLETDAPYLSPRDMVPGPDGQGPVPGQPLSRLKGRNEPAVLPWIAAAVARLRGEPVEALAASSTAAARALFGIACG